MNLNAHLTPYIKNDSKWINNLNVKAKTLKFLEENTDINLCDPGFSNGFLHMTPKATKEKFNWISSKLVTCASKETIKKSK